MILVVQKKNQVTSQKFRWNVEMIEQLLKNRVNLKTVDKFKGIAFESDLLNVYGEVRKLIAEEIFYKHPPLEETSIGDGLSAEEMSKIRAQNINDKKQVRLGYKKVKQKVKAIR